MFKTNYRLNKSFLNSKYWTVEKKVWWWPHWLKTNAGFLLSLDEAKQMLSIYRENH